MNIIFVLESMPLFVSSVLFRRKFGLCIKLYIRKQKNKNVGSLILLFLKFPTPIPNIENTVILAKL